MCTLPHRSSDSGPVDRPQPFDFFLAVEDASETLNNLGRLFRDDLGVQRKLRVEAAESLQDQLAEIIRGLRGVA